MTDVAVYYLPPPATPATGAQPSQQRPVSDVLLFHAKDGGNVEMISGALTMSDGLFTAVYLSLFGGNDDDSGLPGDLSKQWWANFSETLPERCYRSETQFCLASLPPTSGNLRRIENAAKNDLAWMIDGRIASAVTASADMPSRNRVKLVATVLLLSGEQYRFEFSQSWGSAA